MLSGLALAILSAAFALVAAGPAAADRWIADGVVIVADAKVTPKKLPARKRGPAALTGKVSIRHQDGTDPPGLRRVVIDLDEQLVLRTRGLKRCGPKRLADTTTRQARRRCRAAVVGTGVAQARLHLPGAEPVDLTSRLLAFNGPRRGGNPSLVIHARFPVPVPTTYVVPAPITNIRGGLYRKRITADIPVVADGNGDLTGFKMKLKRTWRKKGKRHSYLRAHCMAGYFATRGVLRFEGTTMANGSVLSNCSRKKPRKHRRHRKHRR